MEKGRHPWRATFKPEKPKNAIRGGAVRRPEYDFSAPSFYGREIVKDRAFGNRLRRGFAELDSAYEEKK